MSLGKGLATLSRWRCYKQYRYLCCNFRHVARQRTGHPVQVEVFYEAQCPDSMNYIVDQLAPTVAKLPVDALNVILVPYGKARVGRRSARSPARRYTIAPTIGVHDSCAIVPR